MVAVLGHINSICQVHHPGGFTLYAYTRIGRHPTVHTFSDCDNAPWSGLVRIKQSDFLPRAHVMSTYIIHAWTVVPARGFGFPVAHGQWLKHLKGGSEVFQSLNVYMVWGEEGALNWQKITIFIAARACITYLHAERGSIWPADVDIYIHIFGRRGTHEQRDGKNSQIN